MKPHKDENIEVRDSGPPERLYVCITNIIKHKRDRCDERISCVAHRFTKNGNQWYGDEKI